MNEEALMKKCKSALQKFWREVSTTGVSLDDGCVGPFVASSTKKTKKRKATRETNKLFLVKDISKIKKSQLTQHNILSYDQAVCICHYYGNHNVSVVRASKPSKQKFMHIRTNDPLCQVLFAEKGDLISVDHITRVVVSPP